MQYKDSFLAGLVAKYEITLDTPNNMLKQFVLDYNEKLVDSEYPVVPDYINVIRCYEDVCVPGRKGTCITEKDYCYILLYTGFFQSILESYPRSEVSITKSYVMTILHELAHYLVDTKYATTGTDIDGHGVEWTKCAKFLGVENKYLAPYV